MIMDKTALLNRLADIEWDDFEVKEASRELPKNIWETVSAFANTAGGWIILGIAQKGKRYEVVGVENPEKVEQDLVTTLRSKQKFNAILAPDCKKYSIEGKTVLGFYIPLAATKPVYFNSLSNTFIRTASGDQRASQHEINALFRDQSFGTMSARQASETTVEDLSKASYANFRDYLNRMNPDLPYNKLDDDTFKRKLQIVKDGKLTYGGLLFLGNNEAIQNHFPDFRVDYLEIPGLSYADAQTRYTFRLQEQENLWEYYFVLMQRLRIYANNPFRMGDMGIAYEETPQLDALREALVNMLMHCDYFSPARSRIRVFTNRIEFENPGALPRPVKELLREDVSIPRNPVLAKLFRCAKFCENAGYGFDKMLAWKHETNLGVDFETSVDMTKVTFMLKDGKVVLPEGFFKTADNQGGQIGGQIGGQTTLTDAQYAILEIIKKNPKVSRRKLSEELNINQSAVQKHLDRLKEMGAIRREGADRGGRWIILINIEQQ